MRVVLRPKLARPGGLVVYGLLAAFLGSVFGAATVRAAPPAAATSAKAKPKEIQWLTNFAAASTNAAKADKVMLVYFSGSDWDEWGQKFEKEVMRTDPFREWVEKNVLPVQIDTPKEKRLNSTLKAQNDRLKESFSVVRVPTFLFVDPSGEVLARVGYDTLKLRDDEPKGDPKAAVEFCDSVIKARPPKEELLRQKTLKEAVTFSRKRALPLLILISKDPNATAQKERELLTTNQQFVRFVNRNVVFVEVLWPPDTDKSADAEYVRGFAAQWKFGAPPLGLVLWDPGGLGRLKDQIGAVTGNPMTIGPLVKRLDADLPNIDYNGGWIEDYKVARAVAHQQKKDLFMAFVSSDASDWSQKMDQEIFQTPEFKKYARENLVLLKLDYPKASALSAGPKETFASKAPVATPTSRPAATQKSPDQVKEEMVTRKDGSQPQALREQNKVLAETYGIQGYPTVIVLNSLGQKIIQAKYMKGGAQTFLAELDKARKKDKDRRTLISEEEAAK
jgi:thioredoxin-related protein